MYISICLCMLYMWINTDMYTYDIDMYMHAHMHIHHMHGGPQWVRIKAKMKDRPHGSAHHFANDDMPEALDCGNGQHIM